MPLGMAARLWPTPTASDWKGRGPNSKQQGLPEIVKLFPTPTATANMDSPNERKKWPWVFGPTPVTGKMAGGTGAMAKIKQMMEQGLITKDEYLGITAGNGGRLNPTWVEWLMGFPIGWTALEDSETQSSHKSQNTSEES